MNILMTRDPRPWAVFFTIALSLILGWNALVNTDGILYLRSAAEFQAEHYQAAFTIYPWAFYASLIAFTSTIAHLSLEHAAVLLNALLYGVMMAGFVTVVKKMGADKRIQWLAFATLIVSPAFNDYREYIIRDFGQWAFLPWALYFYMCAYEKVTLRSALGWTLSIGLVFLFRIEALLAILIVPGMLLFIQTHEPLRMRVINVARLYSVFGFLAIMGIGFLISTHKLDMLGRFALLQDTLRFMMVDAGATYLKHIHAIANELSISLKPEHAGVILVSGLFCYFVYTLIKLLTLVYVPLVIATLSQGYVPEQRYNRCIWLFVGIYTLTVMQHLSQHYFLSSRYLMPIVLCLMLWVPFALARMFSLSLRWRLFMAVLMLYLFISGVTHFGYSKEYLREAGQWIEEHAKAHASIVSNSNHALYYSHHDIDWSKDYVSDQDLMLDKHHDYMIVAYHRKDDVLQHWISWHQAQIVARYGNKRGDGIVVIQR